MIFNLLAIVALTVGYYKNNAESLACHSFYTGKIGLPRETLLNQ